MSTGNEFEIFLMAAPGQEAALCEEAREKGFAAPSAVAGGVTIAGGWPEVWRANLTLRGAGRVTAGVGAFHAMHLAELEKRARKLPWARLLRREVPFRVEATCRRSRIYHSGAAEERIARAITAETGCLADDDGEVCIRARIEDDHCAIAIDTSGEPLYKRGHKVAVAKAPMRETMAANFLRQCGYRGAEPVLDPMCGSGTFVIEAAEIAMGLEPGRERHFAFEQLATFDPGAWRQMLDASRPIAPTMRFYGSDWDAGAVAMSRANAERAGVADITEFRQLPASELTAPAGPPGLVITNPPYGTRIGDRQRLAVLYRSLGQVLRTRFRGWRMGLVTSEAALAKATALPLRPAGPPVSHGGLRVMLYIGQLA